jgi:hypothetical protein
MNDRVLQQTCWHESGHVIAALTQGGVIRFAQVYDKPVNHLTGLTRVAIPIASDTLLKNAIRCLAGPLAEQMFTGTPIDGECEDLKTARALMKQARCDIGHADHAARLLLQYHQASIGIIAQSLMQRRLLRDHDLRVLLRMA